MLTQDMKIKSQHCGKKYGLLFKDNILKYKVAWVFNHLKRWQRLFINCKGMLL